MSTKKRIKSLIKKNKLDKLYSTDNETLENLNIEPCLGEEGRMTCYSAPAWWYPNDKYDPDKFRSVYYGDYYNPVYNYLGNAQEMYWDFKKVKNTYNKI